MGIVNKSIPRIYKDNLGNIKVEHSPSEEQVYIDDAFDPLFNAKAREYLKQKYGGPIVGTLGGYAEMWENALRPNNDKWGKLGPAMGVLGTFGRTLDKAEDFILGGLTEGVNAVNKINPLGSRDVPVENPIENIFVKDEDYSGQRLFAAMANNMSKLAGGTTLNEEDFRGTWAIPSIEAELMTDPGILGGTVSKVYSPTAKAMSSKEILDRLSTSKAVDKTALGDVAQLLSNYDDLLAKRSWDITLPGFRPAVSKFLNKIKQLVGAAGQGEYVDAFLGNPDAPVSPPPTDYGNITGGFDTTDFSRDIERINKKNAKINAFKSMTFDNTNDELFKQMIDNFPELRNVPEYSKVIDDILDDIKTRKILTEGANLDVNKLQSSLDKIHSLEDTLETFEKNSDEYINTLNQIKSLRKEVSNGLNQFYHIHNDVFKDNLERLAKATADSYSEYNKAAETTHTRFAEELKNFKDKASAEMPNPPKPRTWYDLAAEDPKLLDDFVSDSYRTAEAESSVIEGVAYEDFLYDYDEEIDKLLKEKYYVKLKQKLSQDSNMSKSDIDALVQDKYDAEYAKRMSQAPLVFMDRIDAGYTKDETANKIIRGDLVTYLNKKSSERLGSPFYVSVSQKEFQKDRTTAAVKYARNRLQQAILETPTLWDSRTPSDYFKNLSRDPVFEQAIQTLNYTDSNGKFHNIADDFKYRLERITSGKYLGTVHKKVKDKVTGEQVVKKSPALLQVNNMSTLLEDYRRITSYLVEMSHKDTYHALDESTLKPLLDMADDLNNKIFNNLRLKNNINLDGAVGSAFIKTEDPVTLNEDINNYFSSNPTFFIKDGNLDLDKLKEYTSLAPSYEIQISEEYLKHHNVGAIWNGKIIPKETFMELVKDKNGLNKLKRYIRNYHHTNDVTNKIIENISIKNATNLLRTKTVKSLSDDFNKNMATIATNIPTEEVFENIFDNRSLYNSSLYEYFEDDVLAKYSPTGLPEDLSPKGVYLWDLLDNAKSIKENNALGNYASLRNKKFQSLVDDVRKLEKNPVKNEAYFALKDFISDDIVSKNSLLNDVILSKGYVVGALGKNLKWSNPDALRKTLQHNIDVTTLTLKDGTQLPLFKIIDFEDTNNNYLGLMLNPDVNVVKNIKKFDLSKVEDIVFHKGVHTSKTDKALESFKDIDDIFRNSESLSSELMTQMGFKDTLKTNYVKHAMIYGENDSKQIKWLNDNLYDKIPRDKLEEMTTVLANDLKLRGTFGTLPYERSLRGSIEAWNSSANIFSTDPEFVLKSQFSTNIYANQDVQTYIDLFTNDNFKLSTYKLDEKRLNDILFLKDSKGRLGNANNLELMSPVFDPVTGKLKKFKRFDKYSEIGIQQALKDPNTVLVPTWVVSPLDRILRKDVKMSNKAYAFFNKYFNLPFKFGTLINPGFLIGNANDAWLKQATTMSHKYGTSFQDELANVAISVKQATELHNQFMDRIWTRYVNDIAKDIEERPYLKVLSNMPESSASAKRFNEWFDTVRPTMSDADYNLVMLWKYVNSAQSTTSFKGTRNINFRDISDIRDIDPINKFDVNKNPVEKVLSKATVNNRIGNFVLDSSSYIETIARSSSVLNDLSHKYSIDDIERILNNKYEFDDSGRRIIKDGTYKTTKEYKDLQVNIQNAINAMNNANFDYNNMPDFVDFVSTFVPFPTFYLKNMAYWLEVMVDHPEFIDTAITIQDSMWHDKNKELQTDKFTAEAKGRGAIPLDSVTNIGQISSKIPNPLSSVTPQIKGIFKPSPLNSMFGAFNSLQNPVKDIAQRVHPIASPLTHHLLDDEDVKYRPYNTNPYQKNIKKGDPEFSKLKYTFHRLNPYERIINVGIRTPGKLRTGTAQLYDVLPSVFQPDFSKTSSKNKK